MLRSSHKHFVCVFWVGGVTYYCLWGAFVCLFSSPLPSILCLSLIQVHSALILPIAQQSASHLWLALQFLSPPIITSNHLYKYTCVVGHLSLSCLPCLHISSPNNSQSFSNLSASHYIVKLQVSLLATSSISRDWGSLELGYPLHNRP